MWDLSSWPGLQRTPLQWKAKCQPLDHRGSSKHELIDVLAGSSCHPGCPPMAQPGLAFLWPDLETLEALSVPHILASNEATFPLGLCCPLGGVALSSVTKLRVSPHRIVCLLNLGSSPEAEIFPERKGEHAVHHAHLLQFLVSFACTADPQWEPGVLGVFSCLNREGGSKVKEEVVAW